LRNNFKARQRSLPGALIFLALAALSCHSSAPRSDVSPEFLRLQVTPVPLDPHDARRQRLGSFAYAGGIEIRAAMPGVIFELSDVRVVSSNQLIAVSDDGNFFEARLLFDERDRLSGLANARLTRLRDENGGDLKSSDADAEGLEVLPGGDRLVSFEGEPRIWRYPGATGVPRNVAKPAATFPANEGFEALTSYPSAGRDAYLVGIEGGSIWLCRLEATCSQTDLGRFLPPEHGLTGLSAYGNDGAFAMLARAWDEVRGNRISVKLIETSGAPDGRVRDEMTIARPLTVDNFEGIVAVRRASGLRLYLLSDDNGRATQHTYLFAFDWQPSSPSR
jgi:hypothetical protein